MALLIPAILTHSREQFIARLRAAERFSDTVQLDILNGTWLSETCWAPAKEIRGIPANLRFELHLMVRDVQEQLNAFRAEERVFRAFFHIEPFLENLDEVTDLLASAAHYGWETGLALNPDTPSSVLEPFLHKLNAVLFLGVHPGKSGQTFQKKVAGAITTFKQKHPHIIAAVDGGVNKDTVPLLAHSGADILISASAIFNNQEPASAFQALKNLL